MFITKDELTTVIYEENIDTITRGDDAKVDTAIKQAQAQVSRYLSRFDTAVIFAATGADRDKYEDLIGYTKDIAKWRLISICNAGVDMETAETNYNKAVAELGKIQSGKTVAADWPLVAVTEGSAGTFQVSSRTKRNNYY